MTTEVKANWKALAAKAVEEGYFPGSWEGMLRKSIERANPALVKELGADFPAYLIVCTARARDLNETLLEQGTPPQDARNLALQDLLENGVSLEDRQETTPESDSAGD